MNEKITDTLVSIPPYVSTSWEQIAALERHDSTLYIILLSGAKLTVPNLSEELLSSIFSLHAQKIEKRSHTHPKNEPLPQDNTLDSIQKGFKDLVSITMKLGVNALGQLGQVLEHNPSHAHLPPLPPEMIERIKTIKNIISKEDLKSLKPPVEHCHCLYCQIVHLLQTETAAVDEVSPQEEIVDDKDLQFSQWEVIPLSNQQYVVRNKLDTHEEYKVFLGDPMGCTCGKPHCEHIVAVLRS